MITILVTGVGGGVGQGIVKCLRNINDLDLRIITADMDPLAAGLYSGDLAVLVPAVKNSNYIDKIIELCRAESVDFYIPGTDVELLLCAKSKERIREMSGTEVVVSSIPTIEIANDKYKTYLFLKENGFQYPKTLLPEEVQSENIKYPVVIKPRIGCRSAGVEIVDNQYFMEELLSTRDDLIIQELVGVNVQEYTCTVVCVENEISEPVILRRMLRSGDTYRVVPTKNELISEYVMSIAKMLKIYGSCNFQLRLDNQTPKLFEINCRFSGTSPFCAQLGMNPVEFYIKGKLRIPYTPKIRYDVHILRAWSEIMISSEDVTSLETSGKLKPGVINRGIL